MRDALGYDVDQDRPFFLMASGVFGILGCLSMILGTVVAQQFVPDYDWVADTISDLGAGQNSWVMDFALYGYAAGIASLALGLSHAHRGGIFWTLGIYSHLILVGLVTVLAARNEYGDGDSGGVVIHIQLVYLIGAFYAFIPFAMASGLSREAKSAGRWLVALGVIWVISAPLFFLMPDQIDGLYERYLGLVASAITCLLSWRVFLRGKRSL